jgi:hypothetical protein
MQSGVVVGFARDAGPEVGDQREQHDRILSFAVKGTDSGVRNSRVESVDSLLALVLCRLGAWRLEPDGGYRIFGLQGLFRSSHFALPLPTAQSEGVPSPATLASLIPA